MAETERSIWRALASALDVRHRFISLTYEMPEDAPQKVQLLWAKADDALREFVRALEQEGPRS